MSTLTPTTTSQALQMAQALEIGPGRVRMLSAIGRGRPNQSLVALADLASEAERRTADSRTNCWMSTSGFGPNDSGEASNVISVSALSVDLDFKPDGIRDEAVARTVITDLSDILDTAPRLVVNSGHGLQAHWAIDDIDAQWELAEAGTRQRWIDLYRRFNALAAHVAARQGGKVDATTGIERIWRMPGSINSKPNLPPAPADIVEINPDTEAIDYDAIDDAIRAVMGDLPEPELTLPASVVGDYSLYPPEIAARVDGYVAGALRNTAAALADYTAVVRADGTPGYGAQGWDSNAVAQAHKIVDLVQAPWNGFTPEQGADFMRTHAPTDPGFDVERVMSKYTRALNRRAATNGQAPPPWLAEAIAAARAAGHDVGDRHPEAGERLDVSNAQVMAQWLRTHLGTGGTSGIFVRGGELVYTPTIDTVGYRQLSSGEADDDGFAQVRPLSVDGLAARLDYTFECFALVKVDDVWQESPRLFPRPAAQRAAASVDDMTNVRRLRGVVSAPLVRPDGTILDTPGWDEATGLLYLPEPGLSVPPVSEAPSAEELARAKGMLDTLIADFPFVTDADRMNYLGLLLTPTMRTCVPAPFKFGLIEAHQPGSGKTFLAEAVRQIHGGIFRVEMPREDTELTKAITAIFDAGTGAVVVFDNLSGVVKSPILAGLLSNADFAERRLGSSTIVAGRNDRLWIATGNNVAISGDMARRTLHVHIDPGIPRPELRTNFAIPDFKAHVATHRADLLWALLTLVRHWYVAGRPTRPGRGADSYKGWADAVDGVLTLAGYAGRFDDPAQSVEVIGEEDGDWGRFLGAVREHFGETPWTAREVLMLVNDSGFVESTATPLAYEDLPTELATRRRPGEPLSRLSKSLGRWLMNREGRWADSLTVRRAGTDSHSKITTWRVETHS